MEIRFQHPTDSTKVIQLELANTGAVDPIDSTEIWRLTTGSSGGPSPALPTSIPPNPPVAVTATAEALPDIPLVSGAVLKGPSTNVDSIWIGGDDTVDVDNGYELEPGEFIPVAATNLSKFFIIGTAGDVLQWIGG
jgi:hypothetical protein